MSSLNGSLGFIPPINEEGFHHRFSVKGLVAGTSAINKDTNGRVKAFASPNSSIPKRWLGVRNSFQELTSQNNFDLIVSHFAFYKFPLLNILGDRPLLTSFKSYLEVTF